MGRLLGWPVRRRQPWQVDAQSDTLAALVHGLETVIERTASGSKQTVSRRSDRH